MDLRSGCHLWAALGEPAAAYPPLDRDGACDVAILGGGITGALVAHHLTRAGVDTLLLDRRDLCQGSTAASTGLLQYELDTPLRDLIPLVGRADAVRAYQLCLATFDKFEAIVADLGDPCGFARRPSLYLASHAAEAATLREECALRRAAGIPVEYLAAADIAGRFPFTAPAGLWSQAGAEIDPYRFSLRLITAAARRGLRAFARTAVTRYDPGDDRVTLHTDRGPRVTARRVVFATGYETATFLRQDVVTLKSTYALASRPGLDLTPWPDRCLLWETARPYFYARTTPDGRALIGGADEPFADPERRDALIPAKAAQLAQRFEQMFPTIPFDPDCAWAGTFGETKDGLPYIGATPDFPLGFFALGYGGNGITFSLIAAEILRDQFLGRPNPDARLFRFGR